MEGLRTHLTADSQTLIQLTGILEILLNQKEIESGVSNVVDGRAGGICTQEPPTSAAGCVGNQAWVGRDSLLAALVLASAHSTTLEDISVPMQLKSMQ